MPVLNTDPPKYKPNKDVKLDWKDFSGGWNSIFRPTELKKDELAEATNMMLTGRGVPTGRWGSTDYFLAGGGHVRLLNAYYKSSTGQNDLLAITDDGLLVKKSGASNSPITGASFASGYKAEGTQLGNNFYIVGGDRELTRYDGSNLVNYATISKPTNVTATNISGASGSTIYSWRVSALSEVGETLGSTAVSLENLPFDLDETLIKLSWDTVSAASGTLQGYHIYRGTPGNETYLSAVAEDVTEFWDDGLASSDTVFPPNSNTTGGPKCKHVLKFDDRLILSGFEDDPSLVQISGRYPYQDKFHWTKGGGYIRISPDDGEKITGLGIAGSNTKGGQVPASILVFKERSVYALVLKTITLGNFAVLDPQFQKLSPVGTLSAKSIVQVENDTFFLDRKGLYSIGSEPNFLNEIRSKELSSRIRPYFRNLTEEDLKKANAEYIDSKYILSFPTRDESVVYDYERAAFMGPWKTPWGITEWLRYYDSNGNEKRLAGTNTGYVKEFSASLNTDGGETIDKVLRTRKEDFDDWSVMKVIKLFHILFRNVKGQVQVDIRLEDRNGTTVTSKSFNITGSVGVGGYGTDQYGTTQYGTTQNGINLTGEEIVKWTQLYKTARVMQIEVQANTGSSNFEFLGINTTAQPLSSGGLSSDTRV